MEKTSSEKKHKKRFSVSKFRRRYWELMLSSTVISSVIYLLNMLKLFETRASLYIVTFVGTALFLFYNVKRCMATRSKLKSKKVYFSTNFVAYFAFMFTGVIIYLGVIYFTGSFKIIAKEVYTFLFAITKLLKLTDADISMRYSLLLFHGLGILSIFAGRIKSNGVAPKRKKVSAKRKKHKHHSHHGHHSHHSHHGNHGHHEHRKGSEEQGK